MKRLYVGNLPYQATESELQEWFVQAGIKPSTIDIVRDRVSGESRGFGFAEVSDDEVDQAITACNGQDFLGRNLVVNEARPMREQRRDRGGDRQRRY